MPAIHIRAAEPQDMPTIRLLAEAYALDTEHLEAEQFLVAEEEDQLVGFGRLKPYQDAVELGCLGVLPECRGGGVARQLVERLLSRVQGEVYVTTDLPELGRKLGFVEVEEAPASILEKVKRFEGHRRKGIVIMRLNPQRSR